MNQISLSPSIEAPWFCDLPTLFRKAVRSVAEPAEDMAERVQVVDGNSRESPQPRNLAPPSTLHDDSLQADGLLDIAFAHLFASTILNRTAPTATK